MDTNGTIRKPGTAGARAVFLGAILASLIATLCVGGGVWAKGTTVQRIKQQIRAGEIIDIFPYPAATRLQG